MLLIPGQVDAIKECKTQHKTTFQEISYNIVLFITWNIHKYQNTSCKILILW